MKQHSSLTRNNTLQIKGEIRKLIKLGTRNRMMRPANSQEFNTDGRITASRTKDGRS